MKARNKWGVGKSQTDTYKIDPTQNYESPRSSIYSNATPYQSIIDLRAEQPDTKTISFQENRQEYKSTENRTDQNFISFQLDEFDVGKAPRATSKFDDKHDLTPQLVDTDLQSSIIYDGMIIKNNQETLDKNEENLRQKKHTFNIHDVPQGRDPPLLI